MNDLTFKDFRDDIMVAMIRYKPEDWRRGQFVFNYIDERYSVARCVQYVDGVDCFYDDEKIEEFIVRSYMFLMGIDNVNRK